MRSSPVSPFPNHEGFLESSASQCCGLTALRNNHGNKITISDDKQRQSNVPWWSHYTPLPVDVVRATLGELLISFNTSASQKKVIGILKQDFQGLHKMKCVSR